MRENRDQKKLQHWKLFAQYSKHKKETHPLEIIIKCVGNTYFFIFTKGAK